MYLLKSYPSCSCLETGVVRDDTLQLLYQATCGSRIKDFLLNTDICKLPLVSSQGQRLAVDKGGRATDLATRPPSPPCKALHPRESYGIPSWESCRAMILGSTGVTQHFLPVIKEIPWSEFLSLSLRKQEKLKKSCLWQNGFWKLVFGQVHGQGF